MANLLSISEDASLAIHTMALMASNTDVRISNTEVAQVLGASEHTLAKVLQRLAKAGLLESLRGPHGGFSLAKPASQITLLEVYEAVEGPLGPPSCLLHTKVCGGKDCVFGGLVQSVQQQFRDYFTATTLDVLANGVPIRL